VQMQVGLGDALEELGRYGLVHRALLIGRTNQCGDGKFPCLKHQAKQVRDAAISFSGNRFGNCVKRSF
jgi:hypothetical protein